MTRLRPLTDTGIARDARTTILAEVCALLTSADVRTASEALHSRYPFMGATQTPRRYGPVQATRVFWRDGFIDRYSGTRVVFPPVLRVISVELPEAFPFHPNWKMDVTHPAYWELTATVDHLVPACRGGADDDTNWVTSSMARNSAKGNFSLDDLGWTLHEPGDPSEWDGLLRWFVEFTEVHPEVVVDNAMAQWRKAALAVIL